jgi:TRAP-type C4-dicarboxylate transport system permease large subunit
LLTPASSVGGMTFGWFTPTEAADRACAWALILGVFLYRSMSWKQFTRDARYRRNDGGCAPDCRRRVSVRLVLTTTQVTERATEALLSVTDNRYVICSGQSVAAVRRLLSGTPRFDHILVRC